MVVMDLPLRASLDDEEKRQRKIQDGQDDETFLERERLHVRPVRPKRPEPWYLQALSVITILSCWYYTFVMIQQNRQDRAEAEAEAAAASLATTTMTRRTSNSNPPNVVFILADDMGYNSIDETISPTLYSLQKNGLKMTQYYTQEVCAPARASLMTGRYPLSMGLTDDELGADKMEGLPLDETTVASMFQASGYTTYMFGKWNLGNPTAQYLPTARGFDYFLGYMDAFNSYWSKMNPSKSNFRDFLYADTDCYYKYDGVDMDHYSTHLYQDKAISVIHAHDFDKSAMFLYLSFQAVHVPFADIHNTYPDGIPDSYLESSVATYIKKAYAGINQQQYAKALNIMDTAVANVHTALDKTGQLDNTYIIFASDNGGCPTNGGRNYPLRGTKGTLYEGGVHVEAFVSSPLLPNKMQGADYDNIFHVSDWFPTMLDFAGISYSKVDKPLDGVSHASAFLDGGSAPRDTLLINYYYSPSKTKYLDTYMTGQAMAVRNDRYKLIHTYESIQSNWWKNGDELDSDDMLTVTGGCSITMGIGEGDFTFYLFDLKKDPEETKNLFDKSSKYKKIQKELYAAVDAAALNSAVAPAVKQTREQYVYWKGEDNYIVPWEDPESGYNTYPKLCGSYSSIRSKPGFMTNWKEIYTRGSDEQQDIAKDRDSDVGQSTDGGSGLHGGNNMKSSSSSDVYVPALTGIDEIKASEDFGTGNKGALMPKPGKTPANMDGSDPNAGAENSGGTTEKFLVQQEEAEATWEAETEAATEAAAAAAAALGPPATHAPGNWRRKRDR